MVCDILAGERGPSCSKMSQIPDQVFYIRFIKSEVTTVEDYEEIEDTDVVVGEIFMKRFKNNNCWRIQAAYMGDKKYTKMDEDLNQTVESHTEQSVQMHFLARNLASQLREKWIGWKLHI